MVSTYSNGDGVNAIRMLVYLFHTKFLDAFFKKCAAVPLDPPISLGGILPYDDSI